MPSPCLSVGLSHPLKVMPEDECLPHPHQILYRARKTSTPAPKPTPHKKRGLDTITRQEASELPDAGPWFLERYRCYSTTPLNLADIPDTPDGSRPPHDLKFLMSLAIYSSQNRMLSLDELYAALMNQFVYYRKTGQRIMDKTASSQGWMGTVRHHLSLYRPFRRVDRDVSERGRGGLWTLDVTSVNPAGKKRSTKRKSRRVSRNVANSSPETQASELMEFSGHRDNQHGGRQPYGYESRPDYGNANTALLFHDTSYTFPTYQEAANQPLYPITPHLTYDDAAFQSWFNLEPDTASTGSITTYRDSTPSSSSSSVCF